MNIRGATQMERRRKNIQFEQERIASLDHDIQRAGGVHKKESPAPSKSVSKPAAKKHKSDASGS